jgi:hypothetical protein
VISPLDGLATPHGAARAAHQTALSATTFLVVVVVGSAVVVAAVAAAAAARGFPVPERRSLGFRVAHAVACKS